MFNNEALNKFKGIKLTSKNEDTNKDNKLFIDNLRMIVDEILKAYNQKSTIGTEDQLKRITPYLRESQQRLEQVKNIINKIN